MTASAVASTAKTSSVRPIGWFAIAIVGLVWLELISRLRLEWSINPQYGYGWTVPFLTAFIFWRRWQTAPNAIAAAHESFARDRHHRECAFAHTGSPD